MLNKIPQVFISYSWTSRTYENAVLNLANKLVNDGINVKLDKWDLKDGQDKYVFMEQCVTNPEIKKVLILCDSGYALKADKRQGGVGDETSIITPQVYQKYDQNKFIPVIMEKNSSGEPYIPAYLKSRMYVDLSGDDYETEYNSLLRSIYDKPKIKKPELGTMPKWLDEDTSSQNIDVEILSDLNKLRNVSNQDFFDNYLESVKRFYRKNINSQTYLDDFIKLKEYRNVFLDSIKDIYSDTDDFGDLMAVTFETMYNTLCCKKTFVPNSYSAEYIQFDIFKVHIWELFVCTTTFMLHYKLYTDINRFLKHTYFLLDSIYDSNSNPVSYERFYYYSKVLEDIIKPTLSSELKDKPTLMGYYLCFEREYLPVYSKNNLAEADLFLYQVYNGLDLEKITQFQPWFPACYIYADEHNSMWKKLKSKKFCEKIMPVFGVNTIDELKIKLSLCIRNRNMRYQNTYFSYAKAILDYIDEDEIATLV